MELTDALFTCLISLYYHLFGVNVFNVTFVEGACCKPGGIGMGADSLIWAI